MCSPPQGLRHSSPPSTGSQDDLLEPGESTSYTASKRRDGHGTLDRRGGELLPLAARDAAPSSAASNAPRTTYCAPDPSPAPDPALASARQPYCAPCLAVSLAALAIWAPVAHAGLPLAVAAASDAGLPGLPAERPRLPLEAVSVRQLEHSDEVAVAGLNAG